MMRRLDYLLAENLRIIQSPSVFAFSLDAVLLARFAYLPIQKGNIIDLCSGNGVIPLLIKQKNEGEYYRGRNSRAVVWYGCTECIL